MYVVCIRFLSPTRWSHSIWYGDQFKAICVIRDANTQQEDHLCVTYSFSVPAESNLQHGKALS